MKIKRIRAVNPVLNYSDKKMNEVNRIASEIEMILDPNGSYFQY